MTQFPWSFSSPQGKRILESEIFLFCILFKIAKILKLIKIIFIS